MKTIDRYIIRMFLINFVILLTILMALIIMIDLILQLDEFMAAADRASSTPGGYALVLGWKIVQFYLPFIPLLYVFLSGLVTVAAMGFTFTAMSRAGELVAMVASGVSMYRIAAPILIVGSMLSAVNLVDQELVIPPLAPQLLRKHSEIKSETTQDFPVYLSPDDRGNLLSGRFTVPSDGKPPEIQPLTILMRDDQGRATRRITSARGVWDARKQGWNLIDGQAMSWLGGPRAAGGLGGGSVPIDFFPTNLSPEIILAKHAALYSRLLSLAELRNLLHNANINQGEIIKVMHSRFSMLLMNVLILAMGLPFFLLREPTNILVQVVTASVVCLGAWFVGLVILQIPADELNPVTTSWLPVAGYLVLSAFLMLRIRT